MSSSTTVICNDNEEIKKSSPRYQQIIATLPKEERWTSDMDLYLYQGFWYPYCFLEVIMSLQEQFKALPSDTVLCSYPKTGTTWLKALSYAIATRKRFGLSTSNPLLSKLPHACIPQLETSPSYYQNIGNSYREVSLLGTHLSYTSLPKSILESGCKIVYICRDPKDTFVAFWNFILKVTSKEEKKQEYRFEREFERFCEGKSAYGSYWDHVLGFWKASLESPERVLFLKNEEMKKDTLFYIRKLAQFLDEPFSEEEENEGLPQKVMELCSFDNLSSLEVNKSGHLVTAGFGISNSAYFRKGEAGDWKNHLRKEMAETLDRVTEQKLDSSGFTFGVSSSALE